ncbi:hypothetical protein BTUL_0344g00020 [Botrytis tulipae]|uniref:Uncharacterized protein n=1 Tax=Botrytis tulipae TaxID=87230 RepID=A0A4Z1ECE1_9HELO|nr:hypothetical protein BTUL_0344g00020 [Botrytis tulipae]
MSSSSSNFAQYGAKLLQAASTEEREQVAHLLDVLFDDPDERHTFTKRFLGASLDQQSGSPVDLSDATVNATPNIVPSSILSNPGTWLKDSVTQLLPLINANSAQQSPLLALNEKVESLFKYGPDIAVFIFSKLQLHIKEKTYKRTGAIIEIGIFSEESDLSLDQDHSFLWKSCKMAATLVLLFATSNDPVFLDNALKSQSRSLGGLPTYDSIRKTPSASLPLAFQRAKLAAKNNEQTTVFAVALVDVHIFELAQRGASEPYFSFAHVFTIGVGPEGVIVWQAWGQHGYRLDEYLNNGHGRVRDWSEADQFVRDFDKLAAQKKGTWDAKCNKLYKKLFLVDINQICGPGRLERPVTPKFKAWVSIHTIQNVTYEDVTKFSWSIE